MTVAGFEQEYLPNNIINETARPWDGVPTVFYKETAGEVF
jgi:hypothetical protein